jgi:hypothetical protein
VLATLLLVVVVVVLLVLLLLLLLLLVLGTAISCMSIATPISTPTVSNMPYGTSCDKRIAMSSGKRNIRVSVCWIGAQFMSAFMSAFVWRYTNER